MKKVFIISIAYFAFIFGVNAEVISGKVNHDDLNLKNKIIDSKTKDAISNAKITIPEAHYTTFSDKNGLFQLNVDLNDETVLFVQKDGYKDFSLTVDKDVINKPLKLGIEKSNPYDMQITQGVIHLGDNMFSTNSANSGDFRLNAQGAFLAREFKKPKVGQKQAVVLKIGTIIGLDTKKAKMLGQNKIAKVYSSPAEVFVNGNRIGIIELNQDNMEFVIPSSILKENNELVIKTGRNLFQLDYVDYDDIELANVRIEVKQKSYYASR